MRLDKRLPRRRFLSLRRRLDAVAPSKCCRPSCRRFHAQGSPARLESGRSPSSGSPSPSSTTNSSISFATFGLPGDLRLSLWSHFFGTSSRCQRRIVSGVQIVATCSSIRRLSPLALTASLGRSSSFSGSRFLPSSLYRSGPPSANIRSPSGSLAAPFQRTKCPASAKAEKQTSSSSPCCR